MTAQRVLESADGFVVKVGGDSAGQFLENARYPEQMRAYAGSLLTTAQDLTHTSRYHEKARLMLRSEIGDLVTIEVAGAYCSAMSALHYNSFPEAPEVLIQSDGTLRPIRCRESLDQMLENEL
jgi:hypothetical protein